MSLTKVSYSMVTGAPTNVLDYGAIPVGLVSSSTQIQAAVDSGAGAIVFPDGEFLFSNPILIKSGTDRVSLSSLNRIRTTVGALINASIATAPENTNALFIIQDNNAHFCLENFYFSNTGAPFTGSIIFAVEGGCADGSGQALFSGLFRNIWVSTPSVNNGFFRGAAQNCAFDTFTCEYQKGIFNLQGVGNGDTFFRAFSMLACYDSFISQVDDAFGSSLFTIDGINAYGHLRGRLFDVQNWTDCKISNVSLQPEVGSTDVGLFKFKDCNDIIVNSFSAGVGGVTCSAVGIDINASKAKFSNGYIKAATGLKITGNVNLEFDNVDFTGCDLCISIITGASGTLRTRNCKFNSSVTSTVTDTGTQALNWYSDGDEFIDAGTGGNNAQRIFNLSNSTTVELVNSKIGKVDAGAAAGIFIDLSGSGTFTLTNPKFFGTPQFAFTSGSQGIFSGDLVGTPVVTYSATMVLDTQLGNTFIVTPTDGSAFTIIPSIIFLPKGAKINLTIKNTFGSLGVCTLAGLFKAAAWTQPANGFSRSITFEFNGTDWIEISRTTSDIPN